MEQKQYDVFISYSRKDYVDEHKNVISGNEVSKIKAAIKEAGITYWFDEEGIYSGQNFVEKIVTNIENAKIFVFLSTANANKSPWTCKEIASADEFKKHIIPVRIDDSPYNKKVLFRIADLDYIEYYTNPEIGIVDLIKSIKSHLDAIDAEKQRKAAEESQKKELERKKEEERIRQKKQEEQRIQEAQKRLISEIKLTCTTLNNEEAKLELDRENLCLKAERIIDITQRHSIIGLIKAGGAIHQKFQKELSDLTTEIESLKLTNHELENKNEEIYALNLQLQEAVTCNGSSHNKNETINGDRGKTRIKLLCYGILISIVCVALFLNFGNKTEKNYKTQDSIEIPISYLEKQEFTIKDVKFIMIPVLGGKFTTSTVINSGIAGDDKQLIQDVILSNYYVGQTEVTQALWEAVMGENPSDFKGSNRPVENVSWNDCQRFIERINAETGKQFRLPTEAEWEVAARGGQESRGYKYSGNDSILSTAWYCGNSNNRTQNVATKLPNELGIYDMSGNVWEWCQDSDGKFRIHRGGSWYNQEKECRISRRYSSLPSSHYNFVGLRLALSEE